MKRDGVTRPPFAEPEGLRAILRRLDQAGPQSWRQDPEAAELMRYAMDKYGALARKHHLEPEDAAVAAFEVMRTQSARNARDPWAVVTRAVYVTLVAEERANGLLCSTHQARRPHVSVHHDAERFSERDVALIDYHPALQAGLGSALEDGPNEDDEPTNAFFALDDTVEVFVELGWPQEVARNGVEYICTRLARSEDRQGAFEALRRDHYALAMLDINQRVWLAMLRTVLGNQNPDRTKTNAGRGVLLLLLTGYDLADVLDMPEITRSVLSVADAVVAGGAHV
ncbi:MAG: serine/arginine repetitive matrix protein 2 [Nocardioides sp.]|uniref:serine/arginine repetitive matrix protein 2 n=1 Tax=Nocardioides sp. TaxID=35761 RepID=UPI0039E55567